MRQRHHNAVDGGHAAAETPAAHAKLPAHKNDQGARVPKQPARAPRHVFAAGAPLGHGAVGVGQVCRQRGNSDAPHGLAPRAHYAHQKAAPFAVRHARAPARQQTVAAADGKLDLDHKSPAGQNDPHRAVHRGARALSPAVGDAGYRVQHQTLESGRARQLRQKVLPLDANGRGPAPKVAGRMPPARQRARIFCFVVAHRAGVGRARAPQECRHL
ncbi:MAG: hypothetical protein CL678_00355 [Bdellovibrionaceae bacterium]|nr:hypothetical protein [Pseudobdellovibrionaceae bacterium]